jgi:hypothetical protein
MIVAYFIFHIVSFVWLVKSFHQWRRFLISTTLFVTFSIFILLANAALYLRETFDRIAQFFGIELGVSAAFFISIVVLFLLTKKLFRRFRQQERLIARLARAQSLSEFTRRYKPEAAEETSELS